MAFGSWLKGLVSTVGSIAKKVLPVAKKIASTAAPLIGKIGGMVGGKVGAGMQKFGSMAGSLLGKNSLDSIDTTYGGGNAVATSENMTRKVLGSGGSGIRKLIPRFK